MHTIRKILVAVKDPKAKSLPAVTKAAQLVRGLSAEIELFHAIDTTIYFDLLSLQDNGLKRVETDGRRLYLAQLERIAERIRRHGVS